MNKFFLIFIFAVSVFASSCSLPSKAQQSSDSTSVLLTLSSAPNWVYDWSGSEESRTFGGLIVFGDKDNPAVQSMHQRSDAVLWAKSFGFRALAVQESPHVVGDTTKRDSRACCSSTITFWGASQAQLEKATKDLSLRSLNTSKDVIGLKAYEIAETSSVVIFVNTPWQVTTRAREAQLGLNPGDVKKLGMSFVAESMVVGYGINEFLSNPYHAAEEAHWNKGFQSEAIQRRFPAATGNWVVTVEVSNDFNRNYSGTPRKFLTKKVLTFEPHSKTSVPVSAAAVAFPVQFGAKRLQQRLKTSLVFVTTSEVSIENAPKEVSDFWNMLPDIGEGELGTKEVFQFTGRSPASLYPQKD